MAALGFSLGGLSVLASSLAPSDPGDVFTLEGCRTDGGELTPVFLIWDESSASVSPEPVLRRAMRAALREEVAVGDFVLTRGGAFAYGHSSMGPVKAEARRMDDGRFVPVFVVECTHSEG